MSAPFQVTCPSVGRVMVARMRMSVDLPAPFGPSRPSTPGPSSSEKSSRPRTPPLYVFPTCSMDSFIALSSRPGTDGPARKYVEVEPIVASGGEQVFRRARHHGTVVGAVFDQRRVVLDAGCFARRAHRCSQRSVGRDTTRHVHVLHCVGACARDGALDQHV